MRLLDSGDLFKKYSNLKDKIARHFGRRYSRHRSLVLFFLIIANPLADRELLAAYPMSKFAQIIAVVPPLRSQTREPPGQRLRYQLGNLHQMVNAVVTRVINFGLHEQCRLRKTALWVC